MRDGRGRYADSAVFLSCASPPFLSPLVFSLTTVVTAALTPASVSTRHSPIPSMDACIRHLIRPKVLEGSRLEGTVRSKMKKYNIEFSRLKAAAPDTFRT